MGDDVELRESVIRLHRFVTDAVSRTRDPYRTPVTVAEIYQEIAPYRTVRDTLGFEMNADYEHALLRLLAGVDGLAKLDPSQARDKLRRELESSNPDVTRYRDYAACDVLLNPATPQADWVQEQIAEGDAAESARSSQFADEASVGAAPAAPDWSALAALRDDEEPEPVVDEDDDKEQPPKDVHMSSATESALASASSPASIASHGQVGANGASSHSCSYCDSQLPGNRQLRYCPFCGADQSMRPCGSCGEPLEPEWAFCIACGTSVAS